MEIQRAYLGLISDDGEDIREESFCVLKFWETASECVAYQKMVRHEDFDELISILKCIVDAKEPLYTTGKLFSDYLKNSDYKWKLVVHRTKTPLIEALEIITKDPNLI